MKSDLQPQDAHAPRDYSDGVEPEQEQVLQVLQAQAPLVQAQEQEQEQALAQEQAQELQGRVVALGRRHSVVVVVLPC